MKKMWEKIKNSLKTIEAKASIGSIIICVLLLVPFLTIYVTLLMQYSKVTWQFWFFTYLIIILIIVLMAFINVVYQKLISNYQNDKKEKRYYGKIFLGELFGNFSICFFMVANIIYIDQLSKCIADNNLVYDQIKTFIPHLINWHLAYNTGAAWSIFSEHTIILAYISLIASIVVIYFLKDFNLKTKPVYSLSLTFILGGTVGNMIDRFLSSNGVVDFIDFGFMDFPTFNIADSFLVVGTILLAVYIIFFQEKEAKKQNQSSEEQPNIDDNKQEEVHNND